MANTQKRDLRCYVWATHPGYSRPRVAKSLFLDPRLDLRMEFPCSSLGLFEGLAGELLGCTISCFGGHCFSIGCRETQPNIRFGMILWNTLA